VGHSLIGLAIAALGILPRGPLRSLGARAWRARYTLLACVALANAPDADYLPGILAGDLNAFHHGYSHTAGWAAMVAAGVWLVGRGTGLLLGGRPLALAAALLASHLAADCLTDDRRPPIGIMALWPLSDRHVIAPATVFWRLEKREWSDLLQWHNAKAVGVEAAWCVPLVLAAAWARSRGAAPDRNDPAGAA
jgi:hypothetical protein